MPETMSASWWLSSRLHWPWVTTHLFTASASRRWQDSPKPEYTGGWAQLTSGLCRLPQARLRDRRLSHVWWLPELIYQSPPFPNPRCPSEMPQMPRSDVRADKRKGEVGRCATLLFMVWCPQSGRGLWPQTALVRSARHAAEQHLRLK